MTTYPKNLALVILTSKLQNKGSKLNVFKELLFFNLQDIHNQIENPLEPKLAYHFVSSEHYTISKLFEAFT